MLKLIVAACLMIASVPTLPPWARAAESPARTATPSGPAAAHSASSAPASPVSPGAPPSAAPSAAVTRGDYNVRLRDLEERVNQLKERIFQSKARLIQLQEVVLHGTIAGAKAVLLHRNDMGSSFRLVRAQYALDGVPVLHRVDDGSGDLDQQDEFEVFGGSIAPGNHQLSVYLEYQGHGYGVFSYLKGYRFKIKSSYTFTAEEGRVTTIRVVGYEKGGITTELKDRPSVRYDVETTRELRHEDVQQLNGASPAPMP